MPESKPKVEWIQISKVKANPNNPRLIKDEKYEKLKQSIQDFPKMMEIRPIVINADNIVLGGNMRLKVLQELKWKKIPIIKAEDLTEDEQRQFIIKDNVGFGDWDWDLIANEWDTEQLEEWGLDIDIDVQIDKAEDEQEIELPQSVQLEPPKEYVLIMAEPNSVDWEELKQMLKLKMVRRGGYKKGSEFDAVSLERVLWFDEFKKRLDADSDTE